MSRAFGELKEGAETSGEVLIFLITTLASCSLTSNVEGDDIVHRV